MDAVPFRRRPDPARRVDPLRRAAMPPRRPDAPLRKPDPNLRRPEGIVRTPTLAVDVGSCGSSAVLVTTERDVVVEDPDLGHAVWPTGVAHDGVAPRVGGAAENYSRVHPEMYRGGLKQLLAEPCLLPLGDRSYRASQLLGWFLAGMRAQTEKATGVDATRAVLTVPVSYVPGDARREALLEAAVLGGFSTVELLAEPLATVSSPLVGGPLVPGDIVLVCDFGGGGFTATLASMIKGGAVELLGFQEHLECSGLEFDRLIMAELLSRAGRSWGDLSRPVDDPAQRVRLVRARRALVERARLLKHQLSAHETAVELVGPDEVPVELTATELTTLLAPLVHHAVAEAAQVLAGSGVRPGELAAILLSGGSSRIPLVRQVVAETFRRPVRSTVDAQRAVVEGAARFARSVDHRHIRARVATERETPLRWDVPDGGATDLHWLFPVGARFGASDAMATVRLPDGSLWELRAGRTGTLVRTHLPDGASIASGDWLVTVELDVRPFR